MLLSLVLGSLRRQKQYPHEKCSSFRHASFAVETSPGTLFTLMVFHIVKVKRVPGEVSTAKEACLKLLHFSCGYCFCLLREPSTRDRSIHGVHFYEFYLLMMANRFFVYSTLHFFFRRGSFLTQLLHLVEVSLESQPVNQ